MLLIACMFSLPHQCVSCILWQPACISSQMINQTDNQQCTLGHVCQHVIVQLVQPVILLGQPALFCLPIGLAALA